MALGRAQSACHWNVICRAGSQVRVFLSQAQHGQCNYWMPAFSSRNHDRAVGIEKDILASRRGAATCGIDTRREFLGGVIDGGSLIL